MKRFSLLSLVILSALLLSACASTSAARGGASWPGLAADRQTAFLADGAYLFAVRLSDGAQVWQYPEKSGKSLFYAAPVLTSDGQLLIGSDGSDYGLFSIDAATGKEKWLVPFTGAKDRWIASPLVVGDTIFAPNNDGTLYALSLAKGELLWSVPISHSLWGTPVSNGKLVFLTSLDHFLYAVDIQSRAIAWKADLGGAAPGSPSLSADGATVYVGSFASKVFAIDSATGKTRWTADTDNWVWGAPAVDGDTVYAADINGQVYSLGAANGKNAWPVVQPDGPITASLLVQPNGVLAVTESGSVYAFDRSGVKVWDAALGGKIYTTPVASGDLIIVTAVGSDYLLAGLSADGKIVWKFNGK